MSTATTKAGTVRQETGVVRHNYMCLLCDGVFFMLGGAFFDPTSVLPIFVSTLTTSSVLIGLSSTIRSVGWTLPQIVAARYVGAMPRKKPVVIAASTVQRIMVFGAGLVALLLAERAPAAALGAFFVVLVLFSLSDGVVGVPWTDIASRAVPHTRRGRLFGTMQAAGGLLAFGAGFLVKWILSHPQLGYPANFAVLFFIATGLLVVSLGWFCGVREPAGQVTKVVRQSWLTYQRRVPDLYRRKPATARLVAVWILTTGIYLGVPFFAIYGRDVLGYEPAAVGLFISFQQVGRVLGGLLGARIADFYGNRRLVRAVALVGAAAPLLAMLVYPWAGSAVSRLVYPLVFALLGAFFAGSWMGFTNYLLELTDEAERPYYLGASNTLVAPFTFFGVLGGVVIANAGYVVTFGLAALLCLAALLVSNGLPEPRVA